MELQTLLITGSRGLVGSYLRQVITDRSMDVFYNIVYLDRTILDLRKKDDVLNYFEKVKPTIVIHLAASVGGLYFNLENNYNIFSDNISINNNILTACDQCKVLKLINVLSTCVFPEMKDNYTTFESNVTLKSKNIHNGPPHPSNEGYSYSKRLLEIGSRLLCEKNKKFSVVNLIPTNLYGKYDNYNLENAHVIPALIHKTFLAKNNNTFLDIKGSGTAKRQFVYAQDLAEIIIKFLNVNEKYVSCIISPPVKEEVFISDVINNITNIFNFDNPIIYNSRVQGGQVKKTCDDIELSVYFDYTFTPLETGLQKTIDYFIKKYQNIRK
jgi:GDP-L-fucose synthase